MADNFGRPSTEGRRLSVGIHTDSSVNSIESKVTPNGNKYIEVIFQHKNGLAFQKIWYPRLDDVKPKEGQTMEKARQYAIDNFTGSLYTLLDALGAGEVSADSAEKFADKAITAITAASAKGAKCTIILHWDLKGEWPEFPRYNWAAHSEMPIDSIDTSKFRMKKEDTNARTVPSTSRKMEDGDLF